jgi:hypothetical protein
MDDTNRVGGIWDAHRKKTDDQIKCDDKTRKSYLLKYGNEPFDLMTLPRCGAKKKRTGEPCGRFGNLSNGRCYLHGGRSTGAKSEAGRMAISKANSKNKKSWTPEVYEENKKWDFVREQLKVIKAHRESELS